jgi:hypothetical protein
MGILMARRRLMKLKRRSSLPNAWRTSQVIFFSLAEKASDASKDQQVDAYYIFHLFLDEVAKAKMEKAKPKGNVRQYELIGAEPYSLDEEAKFENAEEEQEE